LVSLIFGGELIQKLRHWRFIVRSAVAKSQISEDEFLIFQPRVPLTVYCPPRSVLETGTRKHAPRACTSSVLSYIRARYLGAALYHVVHGETDSRAKTRASPG